MDLKVLDKPPTRLIEVDHGFNPNYNQAGKSARLTNFIKLKKLGKMIRLMPGPPKAPVARLQLPCTCVIAWIGCLCLLIVQQSEFVVPIYLPCRTSNIPIQRYYQF